MPHHERYRRSLLLGQRQKLSRKREQSVAINRRCVGGPGAEEDRIQQQGIFGWLSEGFGFFDQYTRPLGSRLGLRRRMPFHPQEWGYDRNL